MTSKNIPCHSKSPKGAVPFLLKPAGKAYLWGGRRLIDDFGKEAMEECLAEAWECSTHPDGVSIAASGCFCGKGLDEILRSHPEYLGEHCLQKYGREFCQSGQLPILIKFIDAKQDLSVQVHPDDAYATTQENGQWGKTELWYVLEAAADARLVYGLYQNVTAAELREAIGSGQLGKYLQRIPVHKNDLFLVQAGTIHAIGAGTLMAEIQQNSNLTYRLYDYDRADSNGNKRPLHVEKALAVANLNAMPKPRQPLRVLRYQPGAATELLCRCEYFQVVRLLLNTERCRTLAQYRADSSSFRVLLCLEGCGSLSFTGETLNFFKGDCIFVPADSMDFRIHGKAQFLDIRA